MLDITEHIEYLLLHHDCVVVPGLGAFLMNVTHAFYDSKAGQFYPPHRSLGFNPEVRHNDGLLAASISRKECLGIENARMLLDAEVAAMRHQLEFTGEVSMGNLGILYKGATPDAPVFEPSKYSITSLRYAGLNSINVKPIVQTEDVMSIANDSPRILSIPTPLKIVASIIVIMVGLGILYSTTGLVRSPEVTFASLDTGISLNAETTLPMETSFVSEPEPDISREIELFISAPANEALTETSAQIEDSSHFNDGDRYLLVVASLPSHKAAVKHINGNPDLRIIEMDGNYRVYVGTCPTINKARAMADDVASQYPNVWVCKR